VRQSVLLAAAPTGVQAVVQIATSVYSRAGKLLNREDGRAIDRDYWRPCCFDTAATVLSPLQAAAEESRIEQTLRSLHHTCAHCDTS
jgi:uncharacterized protein (DUF927 family)